ncbi:MAG: hypothetical protein F2613_00810 [Actinobacteria bacterium]|uniref:Unannotated protein n=1 Tax=freshwater metagenome TaxID=449393 RepID=A0A6J6IYF2_9ZZZZ|nr:hypothetical protein [Actinomycetota bacterium]
MEWFWAIGFAVAMLLWSGIYLIRKLLRFGPPAKKLATQLEALNAANAKVPEIAKALSALGDDSAIHIARRQQLLREARERKRQRERRLRSRDF